jgi:signal transduction histidine kinase
MREVGGVRWGDRWPTVLAFPAAWVAAGLVSRLFLLDGSLALVWPPAGVAVLWFLVRGVTWRSPETLVLATAALGVSLATGASWQLSAVLAVSNTVQTLAAVTLLRRWSPELWGCGGTRGFDSVRVLGRALVAVVVGMAAGALLGAVGSLLAGEPTGWQEAGLWFNRQLSGVLLITPVGLLVGQRLATPRPRPPLVGGRLGALEYAAALVFTVVLHAAALGASSLPVGFLLPVASVWVGVRFRPLATALHASLTGLGTVVATLAGFGRFAEISSPAVQAALAQGYVVLLLFIGLALSTRREENRALERELRAAGQRARFQAELLHSVITSMTEGVAVVDRDDHVVVSNPAADRLGYVDPGRGGDEHPGFEVFHPDGTRVPPAQRPSQRAMRGETVQDEEVVLAPDGLGQVLSVSAVPLVGEDGEAGSRALLMFRDTTDAYTRRTELASFAGTVAHDLRNPLAAIEGWTEMLEDELVTGELDPEMVRSFIQQLRLASGRMHSLIADLLDHAASGNRRLEVEKVDLVEVVTAVAATRGGGGRVEVRGDLPWVSADRVLVSQVFDNLVGNGLKYVAPGTAPHVVVTGGRAGAGWARITVTDNGVGLPPGEQERIFQEFHRAHGSTFEGTGLGLAIVRRIVLRHGGTVSAHNRTDGPTGAVFEVTLPAYD